MRTSLLTKNVHRFAVFTACSTFLLLIAGALVTSNDAGLSVPDWPLSYGSLLPPMVGGIRYEDGHRKVAALVVLLTIALTIWLWRVESRAWVRWLSIAAVGAIFLQAVLGGLTVLFFLPPPISAAHATLAQLLFTTVVAIALVTSAWWRRERGAISDSGSPRIHSLAIATAAATLVQLILGAAFRHKGFGIIPHLIGAVVVTGMIFWLATALRSRFSSVPVLRNLGSALYGLIGLQLTLGGAAWWSRIYGAQFPQPIPVTVTLTVVHTVTGALVLATTAMVGFVCYRMVGSSAAERVAIGAMEMGESGMVATPGVAARQP